MGPDGLLYFTDYNDGLLIRSNLDGTNPELVASGLTNPSAIAFVPEPSLAGVAAGGLATMLVRRSRRRR